LTKRRKRWSERNGAYVRKKSRIKHLVQAGGHRSSDQAKVSGHSLTTREVVTGFLTLHVTVGGKEVTKRGTQEPPIRSGASFAMYFCLIALSSAFGNGGKTEKGGGLKRGIRESPKGEKDERRGAFVKNETPARGV